MKSAVRIALTLVFCLIYSSIDGKLVGTTPSTVQLTPGEHTISIDKSGFKQWQRTITVTAGGAINLEATLDKLP